MEVDSIIDLLKQTVKAWSEDKATRLAAALSFYGIFSLAPLVIILIAVMGTVLDQRAVQQVVIAQLQLNIGKDGAEFITNALKSENLVGPNILVTLITVGSLLVAAIGIFVHLKASFNMIWKSEGRHSSHVLRFAHENAISFGLVMITGVLFFVSLILSTVITIVANFFHNSLPYPQFFVLFLNQIISYFIMTLLFGTLFKLLPDKDIKWSDVWEGAIFTATLFIIGKFFIGFYISHTAIASKYGAAGSLIVVLLWIYYSAQILFLGAEFTKVYTYKFGSLKKETARKITPAAKVAGSFIEGFVKSFIRK